MIEQGQFVHWVPEPHLAQYDDMHQRATVAEIVDAEHNIVTLHIPQGSQGKGWPVNHWHVADNVPYSATCEPNTWHEVDINDMPSDENYEQEMCRGGQFIKRLKFHDTSHRKIFVEEIKQERAEIANAKIVGAVGDGITDDTAAVQTAIDRTYK